MVQMGDDRVCLVYRLCRTIDGRHRMGRRIVVRKSRRLFSARLSWLAAARYQLNCFIHRWLNALIYWLFINALITIIYTQLNWRRWRFINTLSSAFEWLNPFFVSIHWQTLSLTTILHLYTKSLTIQMIRLFNRYLFVYGWKGVLRRSLKRLVTDVKAYPDV